MSILEEPDEQSFIGLIPPDKDDLISVNEFFSGRDVFITGALGFMGKVLVEKLLWECEDIGNLYVLVRPMKGEAAEKRLEKMFALPIFERIKKKDPTIISKVLPICGDLTVPELGISLEDRKLLEERVSVVFHVASTVRFDEPIKRAILLNVRGTREVVTLCKNMKNLKAMVYVSTAYSNTSKSVIQETVSPVEWRSIIKAAEEIDENILNIMSAKMIGSHPNTYTFSKEIAESVIYEHRYEIPTIIYRPSIVIFSAYEPLPGWIESLNGPVGVSIGIMTGVVHVLYGDSKSTNDFIPCDYAINGLIATAWYRGLVTNNECVAINAADGETKWDKSMEGVYVMSNNVLWTMPPEITLWHPWLISTTNRFLYTFLFWIAHLLPAVLIDIVLRLKGIKFRMLILYRRIFIGNDALHYFLKNEWTILTDNFQSMNQFLLPEDKVSFNHDMRTFCLHNAYEDGMRGFKKYMLNEDVTEAGLQKARKKFAIMYWIDRVVRGLFAASLVWVTYQLIQKYKTELYNLF